MLKMTRNLEFKWTMMKYIPNNDISQKFLTN